MARWLNRLTRETVIVHTADGRSLKGVLRAVYTDCLVLNDATYLSPAGDGGAIMNTPVDGEAVIPREKVAWLQALREVRT